MHAVESLQNKAVKIMQRYDKLYVSIQLEPFGKRNSIYLGPKNIMQWKPLISVDKACYFFSFDIISFTCCALTIMKSRCMLVSTKCQLVYLIHNSQYAGLIEL